MSSNNDPVGPAAEQRVADFDNCLAKNPHPVASEIQDFMMKMSYAFPSTDVLVPTPMAVSILGQLTIVAASMDFKLVTPRDGFKHVLYSDSFCATITQLVDTGVRALNDSYANFDEMNKRCGTVRSLVNEIIQLLVGHKSNTSEQNDMAVQRHLPLHVDSLRNSIKVCLDKAESTHNAFHDLLNLTIEIHASCVATQGLNDTELHKAKLHKSSMEKSEEATREMKRIGEEALQRARQECDAAQKMFSDTVTSVPGEKEHASPGGRVETIANTLVLGLHHCMMRRTPPPPPLEKEATTLPTSQSNLSLNSSMSDITDRGYEQASVLRTCAEGLYALLTVESDGRLDWDLIKSRESGGCLKVAVKCEEVISSLTDDNRDASDVTITAIKLAKRGKELADTAGGIMPPGSPTTVEKITNNVSAWHEEVIKFTSTADLKLNTSLLNMPSIFLPPPPAKRALFGIRKAKYAMQIAQYKLQATQAQLDASRASSKAASDKLIEVNRQLGHIMSQLVEIDVQKQNWEEITSILLKAIGFLSELKIYLNNLVHFFDSVHNFVSVSFKDFADQFISVVKTSSGIEDTSSGPRMKQTNGITLDAWSRETIYKHALSTAKLTKVVQHISGMYVTLYNEQVHPGVNKLLGMGRLVGAQDSFAIALAGKEIQAWAQGASNQIVQLITTQMRATEEEIKKQMGELEQSFGAILPQHPEIEKIVRAAETEKVEEIRSKISAAANANGVYGSNVPDGVDLTY